MTEEKRLQTKNHPANQLVDNAANLIATMDAGRYWQEVIGMLGENLEPHQVSMLLRISPSLAQRSKRQVIRAIMSLHRHHSIRRMRYHVHNLNFLHEVRLNTHWF